MSVINQVLLDLEKRRAGAAERSGVPNHVRALPDSGRRVRWEWVPAVAVLAVLAALATWMQRDGPDAPQASAPAPLTGTEVVIEQVVSASAGVTIDVDRDDRASLGPAFRLSLELSNPPVESAPIPSSRLIGQMGAEPPVAAKGAQLRPAPAATNPSAVVISKSAPAAGAGKAEIHKQMRQPTQQELAENEYRAATALLHEGLLTGAQQGFEAAVRLQPEHHAARHALVGLLLEARKFGDAERLVQEGLALAPAQSGFTVTLARLQVDRGDTAEAVATLKKGLEYGRGNADFHAFLAALLQRQGQHEEAVEQFQAALRLKPALGVWWLGLGMSLQAVNRTADAQESYRRARGAANIPPELAAFAEQRLKQLQ
jgi:MSHA biogenesis protein MshN